MSYRPLFLILFLVLFICSFLPLGLTQNVLTPDTEEKQTPSLYEAVVFPDRTLFRRLEQADRLFETGRSAESAHVLGSILESADISFLPPDYTAPGNVEFRPTLRQTLQDYIIERIRKLPREARESYIFQYEPTARRLLENAVSSGSLDGVRQVSRKYFPTPTGASAAFLIALSQFERGDNAAAFFTLDRLTKLHPALPETLQPLIAQMLDTLQNNVEQRDDVQPPQMFSESAWLEQIGWRLPAGSPSQNGGTQATVPLLEKIWSVPLFTQMQRKRDAETLVQMLKNGGDVYIPASQPLVVGNFFVTRIHGETLAVHLHSGKRIWSAKGLEYRIPDGISFPPFSFGQAPRSILRFFLWHDRISQQLSSDGERLFSVEGHDIQTHLAPPQGFGVAINRRGMANAPDKTEDLRYAPGSTLVARHLATGRILWQVGKFPYVQKHFDALAAQNPSGERERQRNEGQGGRQQSDRQKDIDESIFTDDEKLFKETWFLGAPLPLNGRLYVIGENDGVLYLYALEGQTGRLLGRQAFAHTSSTIATNFTRRTYPLFPSASEGIVICPTGNGLVAALDATTLLPIWCFTYAPSQATTGANRAMQNRQMMMPTLNVGESTIQQLFADSGWQVPSIIIDGNRILVAPPDQAVIFCLDLSTGEQLWRRNIARVNALYVAGVHEEKVFLVTPNNLMVMDMNTGEEIESRKERFPAAVKPAGVGVRSGNQYYIPFTECHLAVVDFVTGGLTWHNAYTHAEVPPGRTNGSIVSEYPPAEPIVDVHAIAWDNMMEPIVNPLNIASQNMVAGDIVQTPIQLGNLVGIKGKFFSQAPTQIVCFDQKESLRRQADALLQSDSDDSQGLLHKGRVLKAEGKLAEAIAVFRASFTATPSPEAADALRKNLLEAMRTDYSAWSNAGQELESLAEFPEEWAAVLYAQFEGILQSGNTDDLLALMEKVFALGQKHSIFIPISGEHSVLFPLAIRSLMDEHINAPVNNVSGNPKLKKAWDEVAETIFQQLTAPPPAEFLLPSFLHLRGSFSPAGVARYPAEVQCWKLFVTLFRDTPTADKAKQILNEKHAQYRLPSPLELFENNPVPKWTELPAPYIWRLGLVKTQDVETQVVGNLHDASGAQKENATPEIDRLVNRILNVAKNSGQFRPADSRQVVPFLGNATGSDISDNDSSAFEYAVRHEQQEFSLVCSDASGKERWQIALPVISGYYDNRYGTDYTTYITGIRDFLLFIQGTSMIAVDATSGAEKILWSRVLAAPLPLRQISGDGRHGVLQTQRAASRSFPKKSVLVTPEAVFWWEEHTNSLHALELLTGQTLWTRKFPYESCSILGDSENLFLLFANTLRVIALSPTNGREIANGPLQTSAVEQIAGYFVYGTSVVTLERHGDLQALYITDLKDIHDKRRRALSVTTTADGRLSPSIPKKMLLDRMSNTTMLQLFHGDRFLSAASWDSKSLQVFDLHTKEKLLPEGNKMLRFVSDQDIDFRTMRCDVEIVDDRFLVLFTKSTGYQGTTRITNEDGTSFNRIFRPVTGVPGIGINRGTMMLFNADGTPCWTEPAELENWLRLFAVPARLPVMLFAVSIMDRDANGNDNQFTWVMGIDKRTGHRRFRTQIVGQPRLESFRVSADVQSQEITLATQNTFPPRVFRASFTDENVAE